MRSARSVSIAAPLLATVLLAAGCGRQSVSPPPPPPPSGAVNVLTYHNDLARTGQNLAETILTPANVSGATFGKIGFLPVNGLVDAEPLYVSQWTIAGGRSPQRRSRLWANHARDRRDRYPRYRSRVRRPRRHLLGRDVEGRERRLSSAPARDGSGDGRRIARQSRRDPSPLYRAGLRCDRYLRSRELRRASRLAPAEWEDLLGLHLALRPRQLSGLGDGLR